MFREDFSLRGGPKRATPQPKPQLSCVILSWHILYLSTPPCSCQVHSVMYYVSGTVLSAFPNATFSITIILIELLKGGCVTVLLVRPRVRIQVCDPKARPLCLYFMQPFERQESLLMGECWVLVGRPFGEGFLQLLQRDHMKGHFCLCMRPAVDGSDDKPKKWSGFSNLHAQVILCLLVTRAAINTHLQGQIDYEPDRAPPRV